MKEKLRRNLRWVQKAVICLAFFGVLAAKEVQAYGVPPLITVPPVGISVLNGGTATFTAVIGVSLTPLTVNWQLDGGNVPHSAKVVTTTDLVLGTTTSTLTVSNVTSAAAGNYTIVAKNSGGTVTSGNAPLVILGASTGSALSILTQGCGRTNNGFRVQLLKPAQSNCVIEATTDFVNWVPIATNSSGSTNITYTDPAATNLATRYYRARLQ